MVSDLRAGGRGTLPRRDFEGTLLLALLPGWLLKCCAIAGRWRLGLRQILEQDREL
jgi:hypothetical protein